MHQPENFCNYIKGIQGHRLEIEIQTLKKALVVVEILWVVHVGPNHHLQLKLSTEATHLVFIPNSQNLEYNE